MQTAAYAVCVVHPQGDTDPDHRLRTLADAQGFVRFFGDGPGLSSVSLVLDCNTEDGITLDTQPIDQQLAVAQFAEVGTSKFIPPGTKMIAPLAGDPMAPTDAELVQNGYPARPDPVQSADLYSRWLRTVSKPIALIQPKGIPDPDRVRGGALLGGQNWGGVFLLPLVPAAVFGRVIGTFMQPNITSHGFVRQASTSAVYSWVGLDGGLAFQGGSASQDVAQAGTIAKIVVGFVQNGWYTVVSYNAFVEWFSDDPILIQNFVVYPGDYYFDEVWMSDSTGFSTQPGGYMWFEFLQEDEGPGFTGCIGPHGSTSCQFTISTQGNHHFVGDTAEWILETPYGFAEPMANFWTATMSGAEAWRSDENYGTIHSDASQDFDTQYITSPTQGQFRAKADTQGTTVAAPLVNYSWVSYW
jgi:hypothetical protein